MTLREFLREFDFDYEKDDKGYHLIDLQGANLGDIESEVFYDIPQIIDRLDIYYESYIINEIEEKADQCFSNYSKALEWCRSHNQDKWWDYNIMLLKIICGEEELKKLY